MADETSHSFEFPVPVDKVAYFLPTIGVFFIALGASVIVVWPAAVLGDRVLPRAVVDIFAMAASPSIALWASVKWVTRYRRIHRERKLVIDGRGITYVKFTDKQRLIRWQDIVSVSEFENDGYGLLYRLRKGKFTFWDSDFRGYTRIRLTTAVMLPGKTSLIGTFSATDNEFALILEALERWGAAERAEDFLRHALDKVGAYSPEGRIYAKAYAGLLLRQGRDREAARIQVDYRIR